MSRYILPLTFASLRSKGHVIEAWREGDDYLYQLVSLSEPSVVPDRGLASLSGALDTDGSLSDPGSSTIYDPPGDGGHGSRGRSPTDRVGRAGGCVTITALSAKRGRVYARKFDHDEARRRYEAGERLRDLAAEYGVTESGVRYAAIPATRARMLAAATRHAMSGVCVGCGNSCACYRSGEKGRRVNPLCRKCASKQRITTARKGELRCTTCHEWKPDAAFAHSVATAEHRRGRHKSCRQCLTVLRRDYRNHHKIPCVKCGEPRLPAGEKGARRIDSGLCVDCYRASRKKAA